MKLLLHEFSTKCSPLFTFKLVDVCHISVVGQPHVAVIREEGSNGDREMSVSLYMAGFEVTISDLNILVDPKVYCSDNTTL